MTARNPPKTYQKRVFGFGVKHPHIGEAQAVSHRLRHDQINAFQLKFKRLAAANFRHSLMPLATPPWPTFINIFGKAAASRIVYLSHTDDAATVVRCNLGGVHGWG